MLKRTVVPVESPSDGGYDSLARNYDRWTWLVFGTRLDRFRRESLSRAFLDDPTGQPSRPSSTIAVVGDGRGHCAKWLLRHRVCKTLILIDRSREMLKFASQSARAAMPLHPQADVRIRHADVRNGLPIREPIDGWVLPFVLDCFRGDELHEVLRRVRESSHASTRCLVIDFANPVGGFPVRRAWGKANLWAMHRFFRWRTDLPNPRLLDLPRATSEAFGKAEWQRRSGSILWSASYGIDASLDNSP